MRLSAGSTIGTFAGWEEDQADTRLLGPNNKEDKADRTSTRSEKVPRHLRELFDASKDSYMGPLESRSLLTEPVNPIWYCIEYC